MSPTLSPGRQVKLKQITPRTEEEKMEHSVAAERRRMRLVYADTIKDLLANCAIQDGEQLPAVHGEGSWRPAWPLCPGLPLGRGRKGGSGDFHPLVALGLSSPLGSEVSSRERECLGLSTSSQEP